VGLFEIMDEFAVIRIIAQRQFLFYTEFNDEGNILYILTRTANGININVSMNYEDRGDDMLSVFQKAKNGELDNTGFVEQMIQTIKELESE
jgi:undecaprenyl pyrophosphate synthase